MLLYIRICIELDYNCIVALLALDTGFSSMLQALIYSTSSVSLLTSDQTDPDDTDVGLHRSNYSCLPVILFAFLDMSYMYLLAV